MGKRSTELQSSPSYEVRGFLSCLCPSTSKYLLVFGKKKTKPFQPFDINLTIMKTILVLQYFFAAVRLQEMRETMLERDGATKVSTLVPESLLDEECRQHEKCFQCIQNPGCIWCKDRSLSLESRRCFSNSSKPAECMSFENPQGTERKVKVNEKAKIYPQVVELRLRKGEKRNITLRYTDEKHRPLDLYIVMDLSCTMKKHKEKVANLTLTLAENLRSLTSDLRIGFGSFVDKPLAPFGFLAPPQSEKVRQCEDEDVQSHPYGFKNHLGMTSNTTHFITEVKSAGISSNIDVPEGTLDGLLQSIVCTERIGWRTGKGSRKLLVISTDGSFHLAGDGKLVGVVLPHDGMCYVDESGMYTHATVLDYPSVSLVRQKIREHNVFVIFAVTKEQESNYIQLSNELQEFAVTKGIDNENSITAVIEDEYKKLVNTVTLLSEYNQKDYIDVKFYAKCPGEVEFKESKQCSEVGPGVSVSFKIEVELKECPLRRDLWKSSIKINPQSSSEDYMTINLEMLCGCDCEIGDPGEASKKGKFTECSNNGYLMCGICECESEWGGPYCNCTVGDGGFIDKNKCIDPNTGMVCNNKGSCDSCGKCKCDAVNGTLNAIGGEYCQCNNIDCPLEPTDKSLCNNGECECSRCTCQKGYEGPRCECPISKDTCKDPESNNKICNNIGLCQCGKCNCGTTNKGDFCEIQHAKINGSCEAARGDAINCIKCLIATNVDNKETSDRTNKELCNEDCSSIEVDFVEKIDRIPVEEEENVCGGTEEDMNGCRVDYIIRERNLRSNIIKLKIESGEIVLREKCPTPAPLLEIMIGIIGAMVLFGVMLLLLWKTITHIQDRREYERFEKAINDAAWNTNENPLYKSTTSRFQNPAYLQYQEHQSESSE